MSQDFTPVGIKFVHWVSGREMMLVEEGAWKGWIVRKHPDGQWVSDHIATDEELAKIAQLGIAEELREDAPRDMHISSMLEQRDAELRDSGAKVEVSAADLEVLTTLACLGMSQLISAQRLVDKDTRAGAMSTLRDQVRLLSTQIHQVQGCSVAEVMINDGAALLCDGRFVQHTWFKKQMDRARGGE